METFKMLSRDAWSRTETQVKYYRSHMKPQCKLQILQEPHGHLLNKSRDALTRMETFEILFKDAWSCMEPQGKLKIL